MTNLRFFPFPARSLPLTRRQVVCGLGTAPLAAALPGPGYPAPSVRVFAAASLKTALDDVIAAFTAAGGAHISASYAGSSLLARHIQQGAPADIFISANLAWMDQVEGDGLTEPGHRVDLTANRLVLIAPTGAGTADGASLRIGPDFALSDALGPQGRLSMALVEAVPAGIYGREALQSLGIWDSVAARVVQTDNVGAALRLVATGEAAFGIVYATDAREEPRVRVVDTFPEAAHTPIRYPAALLKGAPAAAAGFWAFLTGAQARGIFLAHGFLDPGAGS